MTKTFCRGDSLTWALIHPTSQVFSSIQTYKYRNCISLVEGSSRTLAAFGLVAVFSSQPKPALHVILMKFHVTNSCIAASQSKHNCLKSNNFNTLEQSPLHSLQLLVALYRGYQEEHFYSMLLQKEPFCLMELSTPLTLASRQNPEGLKDPVAAHTTSVLQIHRLKFSTSRGGIADG